MYGVVLARTWNNQLVRSTNTSARLIGSGASREDTEISKAPEFVFPFSAFVKTENAEKLNTPGILEINACSRDTPQPIRRALGFPARTGWLF